LPSRRRVLLGLLLLVGLALYGVLDVARRARLDRGLKYHRTDFTVYQAAARALTEGSDPYAAESPRGYRYVYPPFLAVVLMPVAHWDPPWAVGLFFALSAGALAWALVGFARLPGVGTRAVVLGFLAASPFLHQSFQRGQVTVLLLALQVGAIVLLVRRREGWAGVLLGLGGALRLTPLLLAAAVGLGLLAAVRARGWRPLLRLSGGVLGALAVALALLPAVALGPERAATVLSRWLERTADVYVAPPGEFEDLGTVQGINEWRFKNQAPRRVLGTWTGWISGASFEHERPDLTDAQVRGIDAAAWAVAGLAVLAALVLGWRRLRDPDAPSFLPTLAAVGALHLFAERYTWPTHFTALLPALALAAGGGARRPAYAVCVAATALFYAAHAAQGLEPLAAAGCLALGALACLLLLARKPTPTV
jgi:hypothetical protein